VTTDDPDQAGDAKPKSRLRRWSPDDDLLAGLDRADRPDGLRAFFAAAIAGSLIAWDLTFTLGAYHTVFYSRLFQILVVSTAVLLGSVALRRVVRVRAFTRACLAIPLLWLVARLIAPLGRSSSAAHALDDVLIGLTLASVPFTMWVLLRIMAPDYFALPERRLKIAAVMIVLLIGLAGFFVGEFNYRVTTCQEYDISGDNPPANCRNAPSTPPQVVPRHR
jgi:hypothetical protein